MPLFQPFALEQFLSENEEGVRYNFSESGVHPLTVGELLDLAGQDDQALRGLSLNYPEVRGQAALRERIAALYSAASADNVLVTVGASEANGLVVDALLEPGDEVVCFRPTYQQLSGKAVNCGIDVRWVDLVEADGWRIDFRQLEASVSPRTKLIALVNPHNPTGHIFDADERAAIVAAAERVGAWIVADEVYRGTERQSNAETPSFWGEASRVVAINSMSKAYGLPGLRLGWLVADEAALQTLWRRHEYATISASALGNALATIALESGVRESLLARSRELVRTGFEVLLEALPSDIFSVVPSQASAMSFVAYDLDVPSLDLAGRLVREHDTLVLPGACFGREHHFRFSSALPEPYLKEGLARLVRLARTIKAA